MPFFEFVCSDCGNAFNMPGNKADGAVECPACGSAGVQGAKLDSASKTASSDSCTPKG